MARTAQLDLPLVLPAQAQKHVTVNEALARLDAVAQLRVVSAEVASPPAVAPEGSAYLVPADAGGDWSGHAGKVAVRSNGGWVYVVPHAGWRAWDVAAEGYRTCYGAGWVADAFAVSPGGAGTRLRVVEFDHAVVPGASNETSVPIPSGAQVIGVSGRVIGALTGGLSGWRVGRGGVGQPLWLGAGRGAEFVSARAERGAGDLLCRHAFASDRRGRGLCGWHGAAGAASGGAGAAAGGLNPRRISGLISRPGETIFHASANAWGVLPWHRHKPPSPAWTGSGR